MIKFKNFRYNGNKGRCRVNFNDTIKLPGVENPSLVKVLGYISYISRVIANFMLKFPNFHYYGNKDRSGVNFYDTIRFSDHDFLKKVGYFGSQSAFSVFFAL